MSSSAESDLEEALRHVTSSRSPLAELVSDPILLRSITKPRRNKSRSSSNHRSEGKKKRAHDGDTASRVLSIVLAEEEREVQSLRAQLVVIAEQLKGSMRNAADAEQRAQTAQSRERETRARLLQVEHAKHQVDLEVTRQTEEMKRYRLQIDTLERQKMQMEADMRAVEKERDEAVDSATDAKDALRQYKQFIRDAQARDEGLEAGRRLGLRRGYNTGRVNGFDDGLQEGFDEGYELGRQEGYLAAKNEVRRVERARTRDNLDSYVVAHKLAHHDDAEDESLKRTRTWAESLSRHEDDLVAVEPSSLHSSSTIGDYE